MQISFDFRSKFLMTCVLSIALVLGNYEGNGIYVQLCIASIPFVLLLTIHQYKEFIKGICLFLIVYVARYYLLQVESFNMMFASLLSFLMTIILRFLPVIMMANYALSSTTISDLIASLKRMHLKDEFVIPISVMFRFFYTLKQDYATVKDAMILRGFGMKRMFQNPLQMMEYRFVPLLMGMSKTADDVAIAAMCKGLEVNQERTTISTTRLTAWDGLMFGLCGLILFYFFKVKYVGH